MKKNQFKSRPSRARLQTPFFGDTSPISNLATVGQLDLLKQIYGEVIIPETVYQEIINAGATEPATLAIQSLKWIKKGSINNLTLVMSLQAKLDPGEAEAIVLAL
ncbi:MAG: hypothetical protein QNJ74_29215 [Trichodesmium sp. MO_231.B1]|nr:hypothetical protein [Trichodesmium sp. MO_231.B1]